MMPGKTYQFYQPGGVGDWHSWLLCPQHVGRRMIRFQKQRAVVAILLVLALFFFLRHWRNSNLDFELPIGDEDLHVRDASLKHDKWIVVTTINQPTKAVEALAAIPGWKLIVVGDRRTPHKWELRGVTYLDVRKQKALGYKVHGLLPYDSYTRKVIGYLFAIEHGAKFIYDTDDDNFPRNLAPESFLLTHGLVKGLVVDTNNLTHNTLVHFGQSTMWPRGYPLENIGLPTTRHYQQCNVHTPAMQQGLVNGDPDVDALFRLTRKHGDGPLDLKFDGGAPPIILPKGTFAPVNSQNTLFTYRAFWAMFLPTTVSDRATDIFRSYWAQRLLWLLGENVGFFPPSSVQRRNPHSHLMDAKEEVELYHSTGELLRYLRTWSCSKVFFFDCASQLAHDMVGAGFWKHRDADLADAWITDLASVGYAPPIMKMQETCSQLLPLQVVFYPQEQNTSWPHSPSLTVPADVTRTAQAGQFLAQTCNSVLHEKYLQRAHMISHHFDDILLVVSLQDVANIPVVEALYRPSFPHILYCGVKTLNSKLLHQWRVSYVGVSTGVRPTAAQCVQTAGSLHFQVKGFLHITDTVFLYAQKLLPKLQHMELLWMVGELDAYKSETQRRCEQGTLRCQAITRNILADLGTAITKNMASAGPQFQHQLNGCIKKLSDDPSFQTQPQLVWVADVSFYIPRRGLTLLDQISDIFSGKERRKYDFISVLLMECVELAVEYLHQVELHDLAGATQYDYILPFLLSDVRDKTDSSSLTHFCTHFEQFK